MDPLDDKLRAAMQALEASATPYGYFDGLAAKIERRMEGSMHTDRELAGSSSSPPPAAESGVVERTEDSGAHDIKALARSTRQRISRRQTSQHDIEDSMLSSSQSGMHAIALPDPAKMIALPTPEEARALSASMSMQAMPGSLAAAAEETGAPAVAREPVAVARGKAASKGVPVWLWAGGGVAAAAAAVVAFVTINNSGSADSKSKSDGAAGGEQQGSDMLAAREEAEPAKPTMNAQDAVTVTGITEAAGEAASTGAGSGSGSSAGFAAGSGAVADVPVPVDDAAGDEDKDRKKAGGSSKRDDVKAKPDGEDKGSGKSAPPPPDDGGDKGSSKGSAKGSGKGSAKGGGGTGSGTGTAGGAVLGDGDSDELGIGDAIKGGGTGGGDDDKPKKTELTSKELRAGLDAVSGKAKACYDGAVGTVKVKLTVGSSGSVTKASATGDLAGTPAADCVVSAIKGASFPAWTGAPMSTTYAVLLSD